MRHGHRAAFQVSVASQRPGTSPSGTSNATILSVASAGQAIGASSARAPSRGNASFAPCEARLLKLDPFSRTFLLFSTGAEATFGVKSAYSPFYARILLSPLHFFWS